MGGPLKLATHDGAALVTRPDSQVLLLSMRRLANLVAYCTLYEFEDVVAEMAGADRVDAGSEAALERSRRVYKLVRLTTRSRWLACRVTRAPATVRIRRDYELFFPTFNNPYELYALASVPDWRKRCRFAACFINEVWAHQLPAYLLELLLQFDHIYLGTFHCVDQVARMVGKPCSYLPLAADVLRFSPWPNLPARTIDVCNIGRRSRITHEALIGIARARRISYYYDTIAGDHAGKQRTFRVDDHDEHRLLLAGLLQRSRYYIANRARINQSDYTRRGHEISGRFYEGAAAGTVMLGEPPDSAVFEQLFSWPDAVLRMPFDCPDVEQVLAELDRNPERLARISCQNVHYAALEHDWLYRLRRVFSQFGLKGTPGMLERGERLRALADRALPAEAAPERRAQARH